MTLDRFRGCLLGLASGDALGAPFEGGPLERLVWWFLGKTRNGERRWTDDTQMSLDLAESLLDRRTLDVDDLAQRFARSYHWSRGYGPGAARLLKRVRRGENWRSACRSVFPIGSYGNGGAMRAPVIGMAYQNRPDELAEAAERSAGVTHTHPLGLEGAVLIAGTTSLALDELSPVDIVGHLSSDCRQELFQEKLSIVREWLNDADAIPSHEVAKVLGNGTAALESCATSIYLALRFIEQSFMEMVAFAATMGGDVDTICAMAGAIWGARNGVDKLPLNELAKLEQRDRIDDIAQRLFAIVH